MAFTVKRVGSHHWAVEGRDRVYSTKREALLMAEALTNAERCMRHQCDVDEHHGCGYCVAEGE